MATNTTTPFRTVGRAWDKLEPAMLHPEPATKHVRLMPSKTYAAGTLVGSVVNDAGTDPPRCDDDGNANVTGQLWPLVYPVVTDANGYATLGSAALADDPKNESVEVYFVGAFKVADLVSVSGMSAAILARAGVLKQGRTHADASAIVVLN